MLQCFLLSLNVLVLQALEDLRLRTGAWRVVAHAKALEAQEKVQAGVQDLQLEGDEQESKLRLLRSILSPNASQSYAQSYSSSCRIAEHHDTEPNPAESFGLFRA